MAKAEVTVTIHLPEVAVLNTCSEHGFLVSVAYIGSSCPMCNLQAEHDHLVKLRDGIANYAEKLVGAA